MTALRETFRQARRAEILDAARRVFARKGFDAASMQDLSDECGLSAGSFYRYFGSKEELIVAVCEESDSARRALFEVSSGMASSPLQALIAVGESAWQQFSEEGAREQLILNLESCLVGARHAEFGCVSRESVASTRQALTELVSAAQTAGEIKPDVDPRAFAEMLLAVVSGLQALFVQFEGDVDADGVWAVLVQILDCFGPEDGTSRAEVPRATPDAP